MQNIITKRVGDKLVIEVDVSDKTRQSAPLSKTGKSKMIATSHGFALVENVKISLNVISA